MHHHNGNRPSALRWIRQWDVTVDGVDAVRITASGQSIWEHGQPMCTSVRQACAIAAQATYARGWDAGIVHLVGSAVSAMTHHVGSSTSVVPAGNVLFGIDAEFLLRRPVQAGGRVVPACAFFAPDAVVGCDGVRVHKGRTLMAIGEVRPAPAPDAHTLYAHVRNALLWGMRRVQAIDAHIEWVCGGMPVPGIPLGGHIHMSGVPLTPTVLRLLDNYVALPLAMVEGTTTRQRRPRFGMLGAFRRQPHGGFEYRTLPSWLCTPDTAAGVLALVHTVIAHGPELHAFPLNDEVYRHAYVVGDKRTLWPVVVRVWRVLSALPTFSAYGDVLAPLWHMIRRHVSWDEQQDIRPAWLARA